GALTTNFGDAPSALFTDPPQAFMHRQATFIQGFIVSQNPGLLAGVDFDVFPFPTFDSPGAAEAPLLVSGDVVNCFNDRPEVIEFAKFLITREAQEIWVRELNELSSNRNIDAALFTNPIARKAWGLLSRARVSRYDGSDQMPAAVGTGAFWTGVLDYVSGVPLDSVLETLEAAAVDAYPAR
ncbi:MAG: hypothetical protein MUP74_04895, partial [Desulfobacterales bacterium]|nr:hypothetical protein [Desulfobacterales bacterium]